jgi:hypothetical protein
VLAAGIDDHGDGATLEDVQAAAQQGETGGGEIAHRRGVVDLSVEPGLDVC